VQYTKAALSFCQNQTLENAIAVLNVIAGLSANEEPTLPWLEEAEAWRKVKDSLLAKRQAEVVTWSQAANPAPVVGAPPLTGGLSLKAIAKSNPQRLSDEKAKLTVLFNHTNTSLEKITLGQEPFYENHQLKINRDIKIHAGILNAAVINFINFRKELNKFITEFPNEKEMLVHVKYCDQALAFLDAFDKTPFDLNQPDFNKQELVVKLINTKGYERADNSWTNLHRVLKSAFDLAKFNDYPEKAGIALQARDFGAAANQFALACQLAGTNNDPINVYYSDAKAYCENAQDLQLLEKLCTGTANMQRENLVWTDLKSSLELTGDPKATYDGFNNLAKNKIDAYIDQVIALAKKS